MKLIQQMMTGMADIHYFRQLFVKLINLPFFQNLNA